METDVTRELRLALKIMLSEEFNSMKQIIVQELTSIRATAKEIDSRLFKIEQNLEHSLNNVPTPPTAISAPIPSTLDSPVSSIILRKVAPIIPSRREYSSSFAIISANSESDMPDGAAAPPRHMFLRGDVARKVI